MSATSGGPLAGIRVLDLTAVVLGPYATQILADYGADVIKVETPEGDLMRSNGVSKHPGMGSVFLAINRNKRSLALDLKSPPALEAVKRLVPTVDLVVHNMRPAAIERLGLGYEAVRAIKPDIVYCAAAGFGQDGPHRDRPAFDDIIQAGCGLVAINSMGADKPMFTPSLIADKTVGLALVNSILAALLCKERTGQGQYVEVPMLETMVGFMLAEHMGGMTFEPTHGAAGYHRLLAGGREPVPTQDGWMAMLPYTDKHWSALFAAVDDGGEPLGFSVANRHERNANVRLLYEKLRALTRQRSTQHWLDLCDRLDIPATPIYQLDQLPAHPHLAAVGMFQSAEHPTEGPIRYVRPPTKFGRTPASIRSHAPSVGQHSEELLREAGLSEAQIQALLTTK